MHHGCHVAWDAPPCYQMMGSHPASYLEEALDLAVNFWVQKGILLDVQMDEEGLKGAAFRHQESIQTGCKPAYWVVEVHQEWEAPAEGAQRYLVS